MIAPVPPARIKNTQAGSLRYAVFPKNAIIFLIAVNTVYYK